MISERARNPLSISLIDKSGQRSASKRLDWHASQGKAFEPSGRSWRFTCICAVSLILSKLGEIQSGTSTTFDEARADFASAYRDPGRVVAREGALPHRSEDRKRQKRPLYAI